MMRYRKILPVLMIAALSLGSLTACSQEAATPKETKQEEKTETEEKKEEKKETEKTEETEEEKPQEEVPDEAEEDTGGGPLYLTGGEDAYKDMVVLGNMDDQDGYYRQFMRRDGTLMILEKGGFGHDWSEGTFEEYASSLAVELSETTEQSDLQSKENAEYSAQLSYPVSIVTFTTGHNEDTWNWEVFVTDTDSGAFAYGVSAPADFSEDMEAVAKDVFPKLTIVERSAMPDISAMPTADDEPVEAYVPQTELMDFFGMNIDDVTYAFPNLEISTMEPIGIGGAVFIDSGETATDGSLAGPVFDVDASYNIIAVSYSGTKYTVNGIAVGQPMTDAAAALKADGWQFQWLDFAHGTAHIVATYAKDSRSIVLSSDTEGDFGKSEESDIKGNVESISVMPGE